MPKVTPSQSPLALFANSVMEHLPNIDIINSILPKSVADGVIKFKDFSLYYLSMVSFYMSKLSHNQATFVMAVLIGLVALSVVLYFVFIDYLLR
jgi:hypothetical protein